jgi:hypothetical protein
MRVAGVNYEINWRGFTKGSSMFFPCLDPEAARREISVVTRRMQFKITTRIEVQDGIRGLRVWRL